MKILFVLNDADFFFSHRLPIARRLIEEGYDVHLACQGNSSPINDETGLTFHKIDIERKGVVPSREIRLVFQLYMLLKELKPDLVHFVTIKPYLYGGILSKILNVPAVVSAITGLGNDFMSGELNSRLLRVTLYPLYKFAFRHKNQLAIFQNEDDANFLLDWGVLDSSKVRLIRGSGVDLTHFRYSLEPEGKIIVTYVARLLKEKGIVEFIEASRLLYQKGLDVEFWVVGDRDNQNPKSVSQKQIDEWKGLPNIKFFGFQKNVAEIYSGSNIACLPSYREGLPKSLAEAAACGRAVVTTNVPGCRDAIEPDETGLLVPANDANELAEKLEFLIRNSDLRNKMGRAGRSLAEKHFDIEKIIADHKEIYLELLPQNKFLRRKLLFVVNVDWFFLSHRLPVALEALRQGFEVHIATALTDKRTVLENYGLIVHGLDLNRSGSSVLPIGKAIWQIFRVCNRIKPDVVHLVTIKPVLFGGIAARLAKVPAVVAAVSGLGVVFVAEGIRAVIRRWFVKHLYRLALGYKNLRVIFQNSSDLHYLSKIVNLPESKASIIPGSGVDLTEYTVKPLPDDVPIVLLAARLLVDKGVRDFVASAEILRQRGWSCADVRFAVVGKPDLDNPHSIQKKELTQWREKGIVELWGHRSDMPKVMELSQIVVLPSYYGEGLPKVLIEAAACGRVVITTDHPGCRDAIMVGTTGILVPVRNAEVLADSIEELLRDPARCTKLGLAGRGLAETAFDVKKVVGAHIDIYNQSIEKKS